MNRRTATRLVNGLMLATLGIASAGMAGAGESGEPGDNVVVKVLRSKAFRERTLVGASIQVVKTTGRVSYADLDLATPGGVTQLEARVREVAGSLCATLDRQFPLSYSSAASHLCIQRATADGMEQARAAVAAAELRMHTAQFTRP